MDPNNFHIISGVHTVISEMLTSTSTAALQAHALRILAPLSVIALLLAVMPVMFSGGGAPEVIGVTIRALVAIMLTRTMLEAMEIWDPQHNG